MWEYIALPRLSHLHSLARDVVASPLNPRLHNSSPPQYRYHLQGFLFEDLKPGASMGKVDVQKQCQDFEGLSNVHPPPEKGIHPKQNTLLC